MNGKELRSFSHYQIFKWIRYSDLSRNLENLLILKFVFIHWKAVKVSQDDQIRMQIWFRSVFFMNGTELRSFNGILGPRQKYLENLLILKFVFIHCKAVRVSQNDQI